MKLFARIFRRNRLLGTVVGLVLVAGAIIRFLVRSPVSGPDSPGVPAIATPVERSGEPSPGAVANAKENAPSRPDSPATASAPLAPPMPVDSTRAAPSQGELSEYDAHISAMIATIQANRATGPEAKQRISALLESPEPQDQVSGLVLMAGQGRWDAQLDLSKFSPEVWLAAVDLCGSLFDDASARTLLEKWQERMGGAQTAGETAHTLLLEARLPYGGGSTALELMIGVNDPQAIFVGLYEFAVNAELPPATRTEAFILLRDHMDPTAHGDIVHTCTEQVRQAGDAWVDRAERLLEWTAQSSSPDRQFIEKAFARPYSGMVADLELYLRHEFQAGRLTMDAETAAAFRESLANLDGSSLPGPDLAALQRLRRQLDSWAPGR